MNYSMIYDYVDELLQSRDGINEPKQKKDFHVFVREVAGLLCGVAHQHNISCSAVEDFLIKTQSHTLQPLSDCGGLHNVSDLIDDDIVNSEIYQAAEHALMTYKPGKTQVGPGEFFFCLFDKDSTFGIDNQNGFDIIIDDHRTELKKLGTNFTDPDLFDHYHHSDKVDRLLIVKPVSDANIPIVRSQYSCITFTKTPWRNVYDHRGKNGTLCLVS